PVDAHEVAEELARRFKLDMVRFSCSGSEATWLAVKLARAYPGRDQIVKFEGCYHGSNDYLFVSYFPAIAPARPAREFHSLGVPSYVWKDTLVARFNDLGSVEELFRRHGDDIACVIVEPVAMNMGVIPPEEGFLEGLRKMCDEHGAVLIFDEVKTGVKLAYGGAVEYFGVKPDLVAVAKAIAGGLPLSATIGKREIMELIGHHKVVHAGTFNANHLSITAAKVVLKEILTPDVYGPAHRLSEELAKGYKDIIEDTGLKAVVQWIGVNGHIYTGLEEPVKDYTGYYRQDKDMWWRLAYAMMNRGVIFEVLTADDQWTISVQHTKEDVERTLEAFKDVAPELA
ncbi:aspartate aminotransferase family protein, partial [Candidatus Bathyarchaeota archaeon]